MVGQVVCDRGRMTVRARVAVLALALVVGGCGTSGAAPDGPTTDPGPSPRPGPDLSDADLWLSFDTDTVGYDGSPAFPDALGGPFTGRVVVENRGVVESVEGAPGRGRAVAFPPKCTATVDCPRAMVEVPPGPALNPGEDPFAYGASVWLAADQTTVGSNIVQKGRFGTTGGQWKLQVDGDAGDPSCVVRTGTDVLTVRSGVSIADGAWHHVVCRRDAEGVSIEVDGAVDRVEGRSGSVSNEFPISIGSPGVGEQDDQFHGRIDDVFLQIDTGG